MSISICCYISSHRRPIEKPTTWVDPWHVNWSICIQQSTDAIVCNDFFWQSWIKSDWVPAWYEYPYQLGTRKCKYLLGLFSWCHMNETPRSMSDAQDPFRMLRINEQTQLDARDRKSDAYNQRQWSSRSHIYASWSCKQSLWSSRTKQAVFMVFTNKASSLHGLHECTCQMVKIRSRLHVYSCLLYTSPSPRD